MRRMDAIRAAMRERLHDPRALGLSDRELVRRYFAGEVDQRNVRPEPIKRRIREAMMPRFRPGMVL